MIMTARPRPLEQAPEDESALTIKELLSYRLHVVANLLSRGAAMRYKREFGVSLWEWRTIALLGAQAPLSLNELAKAAGLDKSQMSRVVSGLAERGLVLRNADETDARGLQLSLTKSGARIHEGLMRAAAERNDAFNGCLTNEERASLDRVLGKLGAQARELIEREREVAGARGRRVDKSLNRLK
jgi:DNA-binding MarR family transcriptional regulator